MALRPGRLQASAMSSFDLTRYSTRPMKSVNVAPQDPARNCVSWKVHLQPATADMAAADNTDSAQTTSCSSFRSSHFRFYNRTPLQSSTSRIMCGCHVKLGIGASYNSSFIPLPYFTASHLRRLTSLSPAMLPTLSLLYLPTLNTFSIM